MLGGLAAIIGIIGYIPYYRDIFRGTTKPHPFSWIGFALMLGITFCAQLFTGAGAGAWVNGVSALGVLGIAILSFSRGEKNITTFDWICFGSAIVAIVLWRLTDNPLLAVIIVTLADTISFAPTYRKAFFKPHEETLSLYVLSILKYFISIFALTSFNLTTALFPIALVVSNIGFVTTLVVRRRQLGTLSHIDARVS